MAATEERTARPPGTPCVLVVPAEVREVELAAENRRLTVDADERVIRYDAEQRTIRVLYS